MATSRRAIVRSSSGSSRRCSCVAAATSPTRPSTSASSLASRARQTRDAAHAWLKTSRRCARSSSSGCPSTPSSVVPVAATSTIRVKGCGYSVPSRLIGERVRVHVYEHRIEVHYAGKLELACDRLRNGATRIDYRHVIWSLVRKPGAFARYVYRDELFPTVTFRRAYDAICSARSGIKARRRVPARAAPGREHRRGGRRARAHGAALRRRGRDGRCGQGSMRAGASGDRTRARSARGGPRRVRLAPRRGGVMTARRGQGRQAERPRRAPRPLARAQAACVRALLRGDRGQGRRARAGPSANTSSTSPSSRSTSAASAESTAHCVTPICRRRRRSPRWIARACRTR